DALKEKNIRIPRYYKFDDEQSKHPFNYFKFLTEKLGLPFIAKPTSFLGGLGVIIIDSAESFIDFCKNEVTKMEYEIEEFISGTLFHCDTIRKSGKTIFSICCEYTNPNFDFQDGKSVISMPLKNDDPLSQRIFSFNETV